MKLDRTKTASAAAWVVVMGAIGLGVTPTSLSGWVAFTGIALLPPAVALWFWNHPAQSISESINEARR